MVDKMASEDPGSNLYGEKLLILAKVLDPNSSLLKSLIFFSTVPKMIHVFYNTAELLVDVYFDSIANE